MTRSRLQRTPDHARATLSAAGVSWGCAICGALTGSRLGRPVTQAIHAQSSRRDKSAGRTFLGARRREGVPDEVDHEGRIRRCLAGIRLAVEIVRREPGGFIAVKRGLAVLAEIRGDLGQ